MPELAEPLPVAVIDTLYHDLLTLQTVLRNTRKSLAMDRHSYASQVVTRMREHYLTASKAMKVCWPEFAALHSEPITFFGVSAGSYARLIFDLAKRSIHVAESLRQGFADTQHGVNSLNGFYSFSRQQTKELRRRFDAEEAFHFTGSAATQVRDVHTRFGLLLVGFRQESAKLVKAAGRASSTPADVRPQVSVAIDVDAIQATIRNEKSENTIDLPSKQVARWLKVLCDRPRQWIPGSELVTFDAELDGARTSILNRSLKAFSNCGVLAKLIETDNHRGARFNPDLESKPKRTPRRATNC